MSGTMWVMDNECCDNCGALLDFFGNCPECGYDGVYWGDDEEDDDIWYGEDDELEEAKKRVRDLFYQKLRASHPDSPWLKEKPDETHRHTAE